MSKLPSEEIQIIDLDSDDDDPPSTSEADKKKQTDVEEKLKTEEDEKMKTDVDEKTTTGDDSAITIDTDEKKVLSSYNCINFDCKSGLDMIEAPSFSLHHYGVNLKSNKRHMICQECYLISEKYQEDLFEAFKNKSSFYDIKPPTAKMEEIIDSDSDSEPVIDEKGFTKEAVDSFEEKFLAALEEIQDTYDTKYPIDEANTNIRKSLVKLKEDTVEFDDGLTKLVKELDITRKKYHDIHKPKITNLNEVHLDENNAENYYPNLYRQMVTPVPRPAVATKKSKPHVPAVATKKVSQVRRPSLPPPSVIQQRLNIPAKKNLKIHPNYNRNQPQEQVRKDNNDDEMEILHVVPKIKLTEKYEFPDPKIPYVKTYPDVGSQVFVQLFARQRWMQAQVEDVISKNPYLFSVKISGKKFANQPSKTVVGKQVALAKPCTAVVPVSTRVVAEYAEPPVSKYYSGIVAESPRGSNEYRYLIFFDDGFVQYVKHSSVYAVCEASSPVYKDVPINDQKFIQEYLRDFPRRHLVKMVVNQKLSVEWNGSWYTGTVVRVDGSIAEIKYDNDDRLEMIYRGSKRLRVAQKRYRPHPPQVTNTAYAEYLQSRTFAGLQTKPNQSSNQIQLHPKQEELWQVQSRAVAKKSTSKKPITFTPFIRPIPKPVLVPVPAPVAPIKYEPDKASMVHTENHVIAPYKFKQQRIPTKKYMPHKCGPSCVEKGIYAKLREMKEDSPPILAAPLMLGFNRWINKYAKNKKCVTYQTPCGLTVRNMEELHKYLRITDSDISVDFFEFDHFVNLLSSFSVKKCKTYITDISYGVENVIIPLINEINHCQPDPLAYSTQRQPTLGVEINTKPEYLVCCDCVDDCRDKEKCACWQLTLEGATLGGKVLTAAVGYNYKRLPEQVSTGIYECNSQCKCNVLTCLNRVVQHPMKANLQVFRTLRRGWGIRTINDIPHGSFICIYAGRLLTEQTANEGGINYGDEYLAELDYIEVVEGLKEGYESDVIDPEDEVESDPNDNELEFISDEEEYTKREGYDSDEDFRISENVDKSLDLEQTENIRKRLRARKKNENEAEKNKDSNKEKDKTKSKGAGPEVPVKEDGATTQESDKRNPPVEEDDPNRPKSVRRFFGEDENVYIMDAKTNGNIGRFMNHSCNPNVFVQNVFVDTHDIRFPWVSFFALSTIYAGQELTWNYSYEVGSIPGKVIICACESENCRGRLL